MPEEVKFRRFAGKSGRTWLVGVEDWQNNIYVSADPHENESGYRGPRGHNGKRINFNMEDGGIISLKGPWRSNPGAFTEDTGVKL